MSGWKVAAMFSIVLSLLATAKADDRQNVQGKIRLAQTACVFHNVTYGDGASCYTGCDNQGFCTVQKCTNGTWRQQPVHCFHNHTCPRPC